MKRLMGLGFKRYFNNDPPPPPPPTPTPPPPPATPPKTFTQDELNTILAEDRRKTENKNKELIAQLEVIKAAEGISKKQQEELQAQIDSMQQQYMSKEELAKQEREKEMNKIKDAAKLAETEAVRWKTDYTKMTINTAIVQAAVANGAFSSDQMITILTPITELSPELGEDGKPTGKFTPIVSLADKDKEGKDIILKIPVADAVKRMKEIPERFGNLFKAEGTGGVGTINRPGANPANNDFRSGMTPAEYKEWRKTQPFAKRPGAR